MTISTYVRILHTFTFTLMENIKIVYFSAWCYQFWWDIISISSSISRIFNLKIKCKHGKISAACGFAWFRKKSRAPFAIPSSLFFRAVPFLCEWPRVKTQLQRLLCNVRWRNKKSCWKKNSWFRQRRTLWKSKVTSLPNEFRMNVLRDSQFYEQSSCSSIKRSIWYDFVYEIAKLSQCGHVDTDSCSLCFIWVRGMQLLY